ncbi:MAG: DNA methyltransferase [Pseudomonadota bacterium]
MSKIQGVEHAPLSSLKPSPRNARTHSKAQIKQIAASIEEFGFTNPALIDETNSILAGHGRVEAAKLIGMTDVPIVRIEHMTETQKRAYVIADNQIALKAGWDEAILAIEFDALTALEFDVTLTGFDMGDIDRLIGTLDLNEDTQDPTVPCPNDGPAITGLGDIWQIGPHRLICGDALRAETYDRLLDGKTAELVFTDPPYNVPVAGNVSGLGKQKHGEFAMASGEMSSEEFQAFLNSAFVQLARVSQNGSIHFVCMDWRHIREVFGAADGVYTELKNLCVWAKSNGGMGSLYRSQHELVFVFKSGTKPHINNVALGKHGRNRTNVWSYAGANAFSETRDDDLAMHPTVKPLELVKDAILDCSNRGGIVLDAFAGSGTTLLAAHQTGRVGYGIELDPAYCDVILKRFLVAGLDGVSERSGEAFSNLIKEVDHVG